MQLYSAISGCPNYYRKIEIWRESQKSLKRTRRARFQRRRTNKTESEMNNSEGDHDDSGKILTTALLV